MTKYLLDTTALIDFVRGRHAVVDLVNSLAREGHGLAICCVNVAELHSGMTEAERIATLGLIDALEYLDVSLPASRRAGDWGHEMASHGVTVATADAIVAATAYESGAVLITKNVDDFPMEGLRVLRQP